MPLMDRMMTEIVFELETEPGDSRPVYISGNFNNWRADETSWIMDEVGKGKFQFRVADSQKLISPIEYKYIRGTWEDVELDVYGNRTPNRRVNPNQEKIMDYVPRWAAEGKSYPEEYYPEVEVISDDFEIPQLIKTRRIAAILPHDYYKTEKRYPVLYLQDGQNLFGKGTGFGTWGVRKKLAVMAEKGMGDIIIIAIDHGGGERIEEFTPSRPTKIGVGHGKKYSRFLADTLKPHVDNNFRTLSGPENTGIGGSSMGGLISLYAGKMYPEVFSKWMIFSPSLWVAPKMKFDPELFQDPFARRIFIYAGALESKKLVDQVFSLEKRLAKLQEDESHQTSVKVHINPEGEHSEYYWGTVFPIAVEWLFFQK
ncbi:MAG: alpha/beta hydrolase [Saprospiraceae bacterium]|nr:alpha/beta hydrolase [Saprospiraceae bacterium]